MTCCGRKRAEAARSGPTQHTAPAHTASTQTAPAHTAPAHTVPAHLAGAHITPARTNRPSHSTKPERTPPIGSGANSGVVRLRYSEQSPVHVPGPITGRRYEFSGRHPVQTVDVRDAGALLQSGFFSRA